MIRSQLFSITTSLVAIVVLVTSSVGFAQSPNRVFGSANTATPQMRVIEPAKLENQQSYFTVVGAVARSGVFTSQERTIALGQLIAAAGGLNESARPTLQVIRGGKKGLQFLYDATRPDQHAVLAGDIVIVLPSLGQSTTRTPIPVIPVACIGLINRPVVLPLDPSIRTTDILLAELMQPADLRDQIRLLNPLSPFATTKLVPGCVVLGADRRRRGQVDPARRHHHPRTRRQGPRADGAVRGVRLHHGRRDAAGRHGGLERHRQHRHLPVLRRGRALDPTRARLVAAHVGHRQHHPDVPGDPGDLGRAARLSLGCSRLRA